MFVNIVIKSEVKMNNIDFERLQTAIENKMIELNLLQKLHIKETGRCHIPSNAKLEKAPEDLRQYCTEWE